ncbi:MAG: nicotinate-nucleotide adenylyltransferase [Firmicutes bacterium]|nr:nicotinate-nucleotide adenylyltransferase [Bacillota bacterium]
MKRIGILGGSFDPVHEGHVGLARDALAQADLDQVLLIPARLQPFKQDRMPASGEDRMEMLRLALAQDPGIEPCSYELEQEGVSYTYRTLRAMQERFGPEAKICFITGTDSILKLDTWMNAEELLTRYSYIVGSRPGYDDTELKECVRRLEETYGTEIRIIHNAPFDISATEIRERLAAGASAEGLVPPAVLEYIREHGLYRNQDLNARGLAYIREHLKESRLAHTCRVADTAVTLARRFGADPAKAETAAIFHDMAKNMSAEEMNEQIRSFGLDEKYIDNPNLAHSKIARCLMVRDFGITDEDILNAVAYHTTGRAGMSLLEKVVFLADAIEPGRSYPSAEEIRRIADTDLDRACLCMLERTVAYLKKKGARIDTDTTDALAYLKDKPILNEEENKHA